MWAEPREDLVGETPSAFFIRCGITQQETVPCNLPPPPLPPPPQLDCASVDYKTNVLENGNRVSRTVNPGDFECIGEEDTQLVWAEPRGSLHNETPSSFFSRCQINHERTLPCTRPPPPPAPTGGGWAWVGGRPTLSSSGKQLTVTRANASARGGNPFTFFKSGEYEVVHIAIGDDGPYMQSKNAAPGPIITHPKSRDRAGGWEAYILYPNSDYYLLSLFGGAWGEIPNHHTNRGRFAHMILNPSTNQLEMVKGNNGQVPSNALKFKRAGNQLISL